MFAVYVSLYLDLPITRIATAETIKKYASVINGTSVFQFLVRVPLSAFSQNLYFLGNR